MTLQTREWPVRVLVFPCGTEIGLEIHRALSFSTHVELIGASSVSSNHGSYVFRRYIDGLPFSSDPAFVDRVNDLVERETIDFLFPAHDDVVVEMARKAPRLKAEAIGSSQQTAEICRSKHATYVRLDGRVRVPRMFSPDDRSMSFPVFLKPDVGQGSRGTHLAADRSEVEFHLAKDPSLLVLEYLPGTEFTIDCFSDRQGALRFAGTRERIRRVNGISVDTMPRREPALQAMAEVLNRELQPRGAWFFQAKQAADGEMTLMEVAPRVSGSMGLYRVLGVNIPLLAVFDRAGHDVAVDCQDYAVRMDRALDCRFRIALSYQHVYIDLDDTIVRRGQVNALVVAFLYQSRNAGRQLHLLTRHNGDLDATLREHRLEHLFDTIVHVGPGQSKATFIDHRDAIFIDDSHAERARVRAETGLPTFEAASIESLIDWRQ